MTLLRRTAYSLLVLALVFFSGVWYLKKESSQQVRKLADLSRDMQSLGVGTSTYQQAKAIADKYGTVRSDNHFGVGDCADGYFTLCGYYIPIESPVMSKMWRRFPLASWFGLRPWTGYAYIAIEEGKVAEYIFSVIFKPSHGRWIGFGAEEVTSLPETPVQALVSSTYLVSRNENARDGFGLDSSLTPQASPSERQRAWNFKFQCLENNACDEICDVMPEAWEDFYTRRGKLDVREYGDKYLFCKHASTHP
jgi:hypothetical protein